MILTQLSCDDFPKLNSTFLGRLDVQTQWCPFPRDWSIHHKPGADEPIASYSWTAWVWEMTLSNPRLQKDVDESTEYSSISWSITPGSCPINILPGHWPGALPWNFVRVLLQTTGAWLRSHHMLLLQLRVGFNWVRRWCKGYWLVSVILSCSYSFPSMGAKELDSHSFLGIHTQGKKHHSLLCFTELLKFSLSRSMCVWDCDVFDSSWAIPLHKYIAVLHNHISSQGAWNRDQIMCLFD